MVQHKGLPPLLLDEDGEEMEVEGGSPEWLVSLNTFQGRVYWNRRFGDLKRRAEAIFTHDQPTPSLEGRLRREVDPRARICWNAREQWYELCMVLRIPFFIGPVDELDSGFVSAEFDVLYPLGPFREPKQDPLCLPNGTRPWRWHVLYPNDDLFEDCVELVTQCAATIDRWHDLHERAQKERDHKTIEERFVQNEADTMRIVDAAHQAAPQTDGTGPNYGGRHFGGPFVREGS